MWIVEVYRSRCGRWSVERHLDRYLIYDGEVSANDEAWSCSTLRQLYDWLDMQGVALADLVDTEPGLGSGEAWEPDGW